MPLRFGDALPTESPKFIGLCRFDETIRYSARNCRFAYVAAQMSWTCAPPFDHLNQIFLLFPVSLPSLRYAISAGTSDGIPVRLRLVQA